MKQPAVVGPAQGMQPQFMNAVPDILDGQLRIIEGNLFRFTLANSMFFSALAAIALIPIETFDHREINQRILASHTENNRRYDFSTAAT